MRRALVAAWILGLGGGCGSSINGGSTSAIQGTTGAAASSASSSTGGSSSGSSGSTGSLPQTTTALERCTQIAAAACAHDVACGLLSSAQQDACAAAACANAGLLAVADAEQDAGRASYGSDSLAACTAALADAGCELSAAAIEGSTPECLTPGAGVAQIGATCEVDADCLGGNICMRTLASCGGACTPRLTSGACGLGAPPLEIGYYCGSDGGVIPQQPPPSSCSANNQCLPPYSCVGQSGAGECNVLGSGGAGASCFAPGDCAIGLFCVGYGYRINGVCTALGGLGAPCFKIVGSGDAGVQKPDPTQCQELENCDPVSLTCGAEVGLGANCNPDGGSPACAAGICLNADAGPSCQFLTDGARCSSAATCASGACIFDGGRGNCAASCG